VKDRVLEVSEILIRKINEHISAITKLKGDADTKSSLIEDKYNKQKNLFADLHRSFKSVEKSYN
jgi:hypothetical protein